MRNWLSDPVTSFVVAGTAIFILSGLFSDSEISRVVEISDAEVERLSGSWRMQRNRDPDGDDLKEIVERYVKDEIYFRESQRLGLDVNDSIIRRRLVQKLTFLTEDIATIQPLDESALREYFAENIENYRVPARFSFSHRYFSEDHREDARADAAAALISRAKGDPFMLQKSYAGNSLSQIRGFLGEEFATALSQLEARPIAQGPIKSAYGWHTVTLRKVDASFIPEFEIVADRVARDAALSVRANANEDYYRELRARYEVIYPDYLK